jgi:hypothetical protein
VTASTNSLSRESWCCLRTTHWRSHYGLRIMALVYACSFFHFSLLLIPSRLLHQPARRCCCFHRPPIPEHPRSHCQAPLESCTEASYARIRSYRIWFVRPRRNHAFHCPRLWRESLRLGQPRSHWLVLRNWRYVCGFLFLELSQGCFSTDTLLNVGQTGRLVKLRNYFHNLGHGICDRILPPSLLSRRQGRHAFSEWIPFSADNPYASCIHYCGWKTW